MWKSIPPSLDREDCLAAGNLGLVLAALSFKKTNRAAFHTHAYTRIKGAILDHVREIVPFTRDHYADCRREGKPLPETRQYSSFISLIYHPELHELDYLMLEEAIESLEIKQQAVIVMYYYWNQTLKETAKILGWTEGYSSQLRTTALKNLRKYYED